MSDYRRQRRKTKLALKALLLFSLPAPRKGNISHAICPLQAGAAALVSFPHAMLLGNLAGFVLRPGLLFFVFVVYSWRVLVCVREKERNRNKTNSGNAMSRQVVFPSLPKDDALDQCSQGRLTPARRPCITVPSCLFGRFRPLTLPGRGWQETCSISCMKLAEAL